MLGKQRGIHPEVRRDVLRTTRVERILGFPAGSFVEHEGGDTALVIFRAEPNEGSVEVIDLGHSLDASRNRSATRSIKADWSNPPRGVGQLRFRTKGSVDIRADDLFDGSADLRPEFVLARFDAGALIDLPGTDTLRLGELFSVIVGKPVSAGGPDGGTECGIVAAGDIGRDGMIFDARDRFGVIPYRFGGDVLPQELREGDVILVTNGSAGEKGAFGRAGIVVGDDRKRGTTLVVDQNCMILRPRNASVLRKDGLSPLPATALLAMLRSREARVTILRRAKKRTGGQHNITREMVEALELPVLDDQAVRRLEEGHARIAEASRTVREAENALIDAEYEVQLLLGSLAREAKERIALNVELEGIDDDHLGNSGRDGGAAWDEPEEPRIDGTAEVKDDETSI